MESAADFGELLDHVDLAAEQIQPLACQLAYPHGADHANEVLATTRRMFLQIERDQPTDDGPDLVWGD